MKLTLLQLTKNILSALESDEVDSIFDSPEAEQVVDVIRTTYFDLMSEKNWQHQRKGIVMAPYGLTKPTHVKLPDNLKEVVFINYDKRKASDEDIKFSSVTYIPSDQFLKLTNQRKSSELTVQVIEDFSGTKFMIRNDLAPSYYTSFDDKYVVFDSFNKELEDTIVSSKIQSEGYFLPTWIDEDDFIPDMPADMFPMLESTAKRTVFVNFKQTDNPLYAMTEGRQRRAMSAKGWVVADKKLYPNYGRRSRK